MLYLIKLLFTRAERFQYDVEWVVTTPVFLECIKQAVKRLLSMNASLSLSRKCNARCTVDARCTARGRCHF